MTRIRLFVVLTSLAMLSVHAQDRLGKLYTTSSISYLTVEADRADWSYAMTEDLGGGLTLSEQGTDTYDLDGDGYLIEVGAGRRLSRAFETVSSLFFGDVELDGSVSDQGTIVITDSIGDVVFAESYGGEFADAEVDLQVIGGIIDLNCDLVRLFIPESRLSVVGGFGVGFSYNMLDDVTIDFRNAPRVHELEGDDNFDFAWRLNLGVGFRITKRMSLSLSYRYMDLGTAESGRTLTTSAGEVYEGDSLELDITSHNVAVGFHLTY